MSKVMNRLIRNLSGFRKLYLFLVISLLLLSTSGYVVKESKALSSAVYASVETVPVLHTADSADDSAIWIHPTNPSLSTIIGSDKGGNLEVYDLTGAILQRIPFRPNNIDLRYNFPLGAERVTLVTGVDRDAHRIFAYKVNPQTRLLEDVSSAQPYLNGFIGSTMYVSPVTGKYYVFTNIGKVLKQYELSDNGTGQVAVTLVRSVTFGSSNSQTEGVVADDVHGTVYVSEETVAIWKLGAEPTDGNTKVMVDRPISQGGHFQPDIEGLTIYYKSNGTGYLIGSSQGNGSFTVYTREGNNSYLGTFNITDGAIDAVNGTDGIDVTNFPLGPSFPYGVFIAQDGGNTDGNVAKNQNYKLVPFQSIAGVLGLTMDTSWDPRLVGLNVPSGLAHVEVNIGGALQGTYDIGSQYSVRPSYTGVDSGPVRVASTNGIPIVAALRDAWKHNGAITSSIQLMGLPESLLSDTYWFPAYNNVSMDDQLRFGNVGAAPTTITVTIGGIVQGMYNLNPSQSLRVNYAGLDSGPVKVTSSGGVPIIASIRDSWHDGTKWSSYAQLMGLPNSLLSDTYLFPAYNNVSLDEQLRFGNVGTSPTTVTVTIGGVVRGNYPLQPNESKRVNYDGLDSGPVVVKSSGGVKIIASLRDSWHDGSKWTSYFQLMGLPLNQLSDTYLFPAYDNVSLDGQLRFGNVDTVPTTVTVTINGVVKGTYPLSPNQSVRVNYPGLNSGPVKVQSSGGVKIIASIRDSWHDGNKWTSYAQLMGLPGGQLSTVYLFPAYNNLTYDNQLRIGVP